MDLTEFDAMRETKKLLQESLEKERSLSKEIEKLTQEKVKALEDAKMKVVKVTRIENHDIIFQKSSDETIIQNVSRLLGVSSHKVRDSVMFGNRHYPDPMNMGGSFFNGMINTFFERRKSTSCPHKEETTVVGLDEVKKEIREELNAQMEQTTKRKLDDYDRLSKSEHEFSKRVRELSESNEELLTENLRMAEEIAKTQATTKEQIENSDKYTKVRDVLKNGYSIFNYSAILSYITKL